MEFQDGQPVSHDLFIRSVDALEGSVTDMDVQDGHHRVKVEFPHDKVDTYRTTFDPECFRDSFAERLPIMCWQHDLRDPIGRAESAQVLTRHNELVGRFSKDLEAVPSARRALSQLADGTLTDFSFGFKDPKYEPHRSYRGVRNIKRAFMKEFSPVTIGSIPGAVATGVREEEVMAQHSVQEIIALRDGGLLSEEDAAEAIRAMVDPALAEHITIITPTPDLGPDGTPVDPEPTRDVEVPAVLNAAAVMAALPESYQRVIAENEARVFLVLGDEPWGPISQNRSVDEGVLQLACQVELAMRHAESWMADVDLDEASDELRQAVELFQAGGRAASAMLDIADPEGELRGSAEDMDSVPVKCSLCGGSGETEDGKVCPRCEGTGVEAEERAAAEERTPYWAEETYLRFVSVDDRKKMADEGVAMDNGDFPIPDKGHLASALGHWADYTGDKNAAKAHIKKRAKALGVALSKDDFDGTDRADMPEGMKECPKCDGEGKLPAPKAGGHQLTCPDCHGKGYLARAEPDDDDDSEDDMADESGDGKPSGEGAAADEDTATDDDGDGDGKKDDEDETESMRKATLARLDRTLGVST